MKSNWAGSACVTTRWLKLSLTAEPRQDAEWLFEAILAAITCPVLARGTQFQDRCIWSKEKSNEDSFERFLAVKPLQVGNSYLLLAYHYGDIHDLSCGELLDGSSRKEGHQRFMLKCSVQTIWTTQMNWTFSGTFWFENSIQITVQKQWPDFPDFRSTLLE